MSCMNASVHDLHHCTKLEAHVPRANNDNAHVANSVNDTSTSFIHHTIYAYTETS